MRKKQPKKTIDIFKFFISLFSVIKKNELQKNVVFASADYVNLSVSIQTVFTLPSTNSALNETCFEPVIPAAIPE